MKRKPKYIVKAAFNDTKSAKPYDYLSDLEDTPEKGDFCIVESNFGNFNLALVEVHKVISYDESLIKKGVNYKFIKYIVPKKSL